MRWPFKPDDWVAFFFPTVIFVLFGMIANSGGLGFDSITVAVLGFWLAAGTSLFVGVYLTKRDSDAVARWFKGVLFGIGIFCLNSAVAWCGCAMLGGSLIH
jgi:hypothetical protein